MCKISQVVGWTLELCPMMSHVGQFRKSNSVRLRSAHASTADVQRLRRHVRFVPMSDIGECLNGEIFYS